MYGQISIGQAKPDGVESCPYAFTAFGYGLVGQTYDRKRSLAWGDANLHFHRPRFDADECQGGPGSDLS